MSGAMSLRGVCREETYTGCVEMRIKFGIILGKHNGKRHTPRTDILPDASLHGYLLTTPVLSLSLGI